MTTAGANQDSGTTAQARVSIGGFKFYHQFQISRIELKNAAETGMDVLRHLFKAHLDSGILEIRRRVNNAIWNGDGTALHAGVIGLNRVMDPAIPYAGIDSATYPLWNPVLNTSATPRALTRDLLYNLTQLQQEQEVFSDVYFVNPGMATTYQKVFDNIAGSYSIAGVIHEGRGTDLGYNVQSYHGLPILTDVMAPNNQFVGFSTSAVELITYDLSNADHETLSSMGQTDNFKTISSADVDGLRVNVAMLPELNPGYITFQMFVVPQLKVDNRRLIQGITNLL